MIDCFRNLEYIREVTYDYFFSWVINGSGVIKISLTQKNKLFVQEYIKNNYTNATKAW